MKYTVFCVIILFLSCQTQQKPLAIKYFKDRDPITYRLINQLSDTVHVANYIQAFYRGDKLVKTQTYFNGNMIKDTIVYYDNIPCYSTECYAPVNLKIKLYSVMINSPHVTKRYWLTSELGKKTLKFIAMDSIKSEGSFLRKFNSMYVNDDEANKYSDLKEFIQETFNNHLKFAKMVWDFHLSLKNDSLSVNINAISPDPHQNGEIATGDDVFFDQSYYYAMVSTLYAQPGELNPTHWF